MIPKTEKIILALILILAAGLMFFALSRDDVVGDEATNNFRAYGFLDFMATPNQTTPMEWLNYSPWWLKLSFHDYPPLNLLTVFLSTKIFGPTPFGVRLPSALSGLISIFLIYLIGKKLFNSKTGVLSAFILTINNFFLWVSRIGLQEGTVIVLCLATLYFFLKIKDKKNNFIWASLFLGLAFLTKYTVVFLLPVIILIIFENKKTLIKSWEFAFGLILIFLINLPTLIYNLKLYQTFGHFDLQISYLLGQKVPAWQNLPGKPTGGLAERLLQIIPNLKLLISPIFLIFGVLVTFLLAIFGFYKKNNSQIKLFIIIISLIILMIIIGPADRFLTMFMPFLVLALGQFIAKILNSSKKIKIIFGGALVLFLGYELLYSVNTIFVYNRWGQPPWWYSTNIAGNRHNWGFNQLDNYLNRELRDKIPAVRFVFNSPNIENYVKKRLNQKTGQDLAALFIYDFNIKFGPEVWYLRRREVYDGFPFINADNFLKTLEEKSPDYFLNQGFKNFYLILSTKNSLLRPTQERTNKAQRLAQEIKKQGVMPTLIYNLENQPCFEIYKF